MLKCNFLKDETRKTLIVIASYLKTTSRFYLERAYLKKLVKNMLGSSFFSFYIYQVIHIKIFKKGITLQNLYGEVNFLDSVKKVFTQSIKQLTCQVSVCQVIDFIFDNVNFDL